MRSSERVWSPKDILFLEENYKKFGAKYCAEKLNRTRLAVSKRARMIGITGKNNQWNFRKEEFIKFIEESKSVSEVLLKMGLRNAGGNFRTVKKYINILNLDISHFISQAEVAKKTNKLFVKKPIEYYLVENNKSSSSSHIKERLFKEGLKERICEKCGQDEVWNGVKLTLILDHKNGNHYDWRLENIRIVCPNCNATLPTHCRGHKYIEGKKNKDELRKKNKEQLDFNKRKVKRPQYEELNKDVKEFGYVKTGRKYNVSNTTIKKWIKYYEK